MSDSILAKLEQGDIRSIGRANEVVADVFTTPELIPQLLAAIQAGSPGLRMRASDVLEKVSKERPEFLQPFKDEILRLLGSTSQQEVQWHLCQIVGRLDMGADEQAMSLSLLFRMIETSKSRIVVVMAAQAAAEIATRNTCFLDVVMERLWQAFQVDSPAVKVRTRKLLNHFGNLRVARNETKP